MAKLWLSLVLAIVLCLTVAACGGSDETPAAEEGTAAPVAPTATATPTPAPTATPAPATPVSTPTPAPTATPTPTRAATPAPTLLPRPTPLPLPGDEIAEAVFYEWVFDVYDDIVDMAVELVTARVGSKLTGSDIVRQIEDNLGIDDSLPERLRDGVYRIDFVAYADVEPEPPVAGIQSLTVEIPIWVEIDVGAEEVIDWDFDTENTSVSVEGGGLGIVPIDEPTDFDPDEIVELARSWAEENLGELAQQYAEGILAQYPIAAMLVEGDLAVEVRDNVTLTFNLPSQVDESTYRVPVTLTLEEEYDTLLGKTAVTVSQTLGVDVDIAAREVVDWQVVTALTVELG